MKAKPISQTALLARTDLRAFGLWNREILESWDVEFYECESPNLLYVDESTARSLLFLIISGLQLRSV